VGIAIGGIAIECIVGARSIVLFLFAIKILHRHGKAAIFSSMHFSTYIATLQSTFSLLAALLLRSAR
jgi:hypothetical protein